MILAAIVLTLGVPAVTVAAVHQVNADRAKAKLAAAASVATSAVAASVATSVLPRGRA